MGVKIGKGGQCIVTCNNLDPIGGVSTYFCYYTLDLTASPIVWHMIQTGIASMAPASIGLDDLGLNAFVPRAMYSAARIRYINKPTHATRLVAYADSAKMRASITVNTIIDSFPLSNNDYFALGAQTDSSQNGVYQLVSGHPVRFGTESDLIANNYLIISGSVYQGFSCSCTNTSAPTFDVTPITMIINTTWPSSAFFRPTACSLSSDSGYQVCAIGSVIYTATDWINFTPMITNTNAVTCIQNINLNNFIANGNGINGQLLLCTTNPYSTWYPLESTRGTNWVAINKYGNKIAVTGNNNIPGPNYFKIYDIPITYGQYIIDMNAQNRMAIFSIENKIKIMSGDGSLAPMNITLGTPTVETLASYAITGGCNAVCISRDGSAAFAWGGDGWIYYYRAGVTNGFVKSNISLNGTKAAGYYQSLSCTADGNTVVQVKNPGVIGVFNWDFAAQTWTTASYTPSSRTTFNGVGIAGTSPFCVVATDYYDYQVRFCYTTDITAATPTWLIGSSSETQTGYQGIGITGDGREIVFGNVDETKVVTYCPDVLYPGDYTANYETNFMGFLAAQSDSGSYQVTLSSNYIRVSNDYFANYFTGLTASVGSTWSQLSLIANNSFLAVNNVDGLYVCYDDPTGWTNLTTTLGIPIVTCAAMSQNMQVLIYGTALGVYLVRIPYPS